MIYFKFHNRHNNSLWSYHPARPHTVYSSKSAISAHAHSPEIGHRRSFSIPIFHSVFSWQSILQPTWKGWKAWKACMGLPHQHQLTQPVIAVALRLASGGWNESVYAGGSGLLRNSRGEGEPFVSSSSSGQSTTCRPLLADQRDTPRADEVC